MGCFEVGCTCCCWFKYNWSEVRAPFSARCLEESDDDAVDEEEDEEGGVSWHWLMWVAGALTSGCCCCFGMGGRLRPVVATFGWMGELTWWLLAAKVSNICC